MYDKCYFCLDQLPKLKKESTASFFRKFWRSRGTKEPAYITVVQVIFFQSFSMFVTFPSSYLSIIFHSLASLFLITQHLRLISFIVA